MGLFAKPVVTCGVCGKEIGSKDKRWKTQDGYICKECTDPFFCTGSRAFIDKSCEELKVMRDNQIRARKFWTNNRQRYDNLNITRCIAGELTVDDNKRQWYLGDINKKGLCFDENMRYPIVFDFADVIGVDITLGDKTITSTAVTRKDKGLRKVVAGSLLAGDVGAIIGGMMARSNTTTQTVESQGYCVNIRIDGADKPIHVPVNDKQTADELHDAFLSMMPADAKRKATEVPDQAGSSADELRKYKGLLDDGIISQDEFDVKKKQLLSI